MSPGTSSVAGRIEKHPAIMYMLTWNVINLEKTCRYPTTTGTMSQAKINKKKTKWKCAKT